MKRLLVALGLVTCFGLAFLPTVSFAATGYDACTDASAPAELKNSAACKNTDRNANKLEDRIKGALGWVFYLIGALAVIMIVYGGITYSTSAGDSGKVAKAKHIIMYSIIGLVVAILGSVIVNFVISNVWK
jgi:hypothetical protein